MEPVDSYVGRERRENSDVERRIALREAAGLAAARDAGHAVTPRRQPRSPVKLQCSLMR